MPISAKFKAAQKKVMQARKRAKAKPTTQRALTAAIHRASESKFIDVPCPNDLTIGSTSMISNDLNGNANSTLINGVQAGVANYQRVGNKIRIQSIRAKVTFTQQHGQTISQSPAALGNKVRFVIVWDRDVSNAAPNFSSIFQSRTQDGTVTTGLNTPLKVEENARFRVLHDEVIDFNAPFGPPTTASYLQTAPPPPPNITLYDYGYGTGTTNGSYSIERVTRDIYIDCSKKNMETRFLSTANPMTPSNIANGALYVIARAGNASVTSSHCGFSTDSYIRIRYTDV